MKRTLFLAFLFSAAALLPSSRLLAEEEGSSIDLKETNSKIEQVLTTQQEILKELAELKSEMQILKVRVSQNQ
jgi:septal ring factor EnvC (AmiA/AmiB activator)